MSGSIRRFRHRNGFYTTDYLEWVRGKGTTIVEKTGERIEARCYPLSSCLNFVHSGEWVEIQMEAKEGGK